MEEKNASHTVLLSSSACHNHCGEMLRCDCSFALCGPLAFVGSDDNNANISQKKTIANVSTRTLKLRQENVIGCVYTYLNMLLKPT